MQFSVYPTLLLESDKSKEVTFLMQSSANPTLLLGGDASFDHVLSIYDFVPFEQGRIPLSLSTLPPIPRVVSFDWNDIVEPQLPSSMPLQIRGILQYIVDKVTSINILFSLTWKDLGFPNLVSAIYELLTFQRIPSQESWPPL